MEFYIEAYNTINAKIVTTVFGLQYAPLFNYKAGKYIHKLQPTIFHFRRYWQLLLRSGASHETSQNTDDT